MTNFQYDASDLAKEFEERFRACMDTLGYTTTSITIYPPEDEQIKVEVKGVAGFWGLQAHADYRNRRTSEIEIARYACNWSPKHSIEQNFPRLDSEIQRKKEREWEFKTAVKRDDVEAMADAALSDAHDGDKKASRVVVGASGK